MQQLKHSLKAETTDEGIVITGRTFDAKEMLKQMGARWNPEKKAWVLPVGTDLTDLILPPPEKKPRVKREPKQPPPKPWWFCGCEGAYIVSMRSQMHSCRKCAERANPHDPCRGTCYVRGSPYRQDD
jgi:hypothetical protein